MMRVRLMTGSVAALAMVLALSGCSGVKSALDAKLAPKPTKITVEATVAAVGAPIAGTIPAGFPDTLPLWPGAKVVKTKVTKTPNGKSYSMSMSTPDPYIDVLTGVGKGLTDGGWKVTATDASTPDIKASILIISGPSGEGVVTVNQPNGSPVGIEYVFTPK